MKNKIYALFLLFLSSLPHFAHAEQREGTTMEEAKQIALTHARLKEDEIHSLKIEKEFDGNILQYEIEFYKDDIEYEYAVNIENGKIIQYSYEKNSASITPFQPDNAILPIRKIKEIALSHAKIKGDEAHFIKISQEIKRGYNIYTLKFIHDDLEYNYAINAVNGELIEYKVKDYR